MEGWLDQGYGKCFLSHPEVAAKIQSALLHFHEVKYILHAWVIMPNHLHLLLSLLKGYHLNQVVRDFKKYSARMCNKILNRHGEFWYRDYYDRYIRDAMHYNNSLSYIHHNPVQAKLCLRPEDWRFSSAWSGN